jgi:hypothetical protein
MKRKELFIHTRRRERITINSSERRSEDAGSRKMAIKGADNERIGEELFDAVKQQQRQIDELKATIAELVVNMKVNRKEEL